MKKNTVIVICLIVLLTLSSGMIAYSKEVSNDKDRFIQELSSDDAVIREKAIDQFVSEFSLTLEEMLKKSDIVTTDKENDQGEMIRGLMIEAFSKMSETHKDKLKETLKDTLNKSENREMIAPFLGVLLQIIKQEVNKDIKENCKDK